MPIKSKLIAIWIILRKQLSVLFSLFYNSSENNETKHHIYPDFPRHIFPMPSATPNTARNGDNNPLLRKNIQIYQHINNFNHNCGGSHPLFCHQVFLLHEYQHQYSCRCCQRGEQSKLGCWYQSAEEEASTITLRYADSTSESQSDWACLQQWTEQPLLAATALFV